MECWLATLNASSPAMSHALEKTKAARIGVICLSASSKLSASCLHGYSVSIRKIQGCFFWKAIFATSPIVPAVTIHNLPWTNEGWNMSLVFSVWHPPWFFVLWRQGHFVWCVDFQFRGCIRHRKWLLSSKRGQSQFGAILGYRPSRSCHAVPARRWNNMLELRLATPNASSPTTSHALQQVKFKSCSNRSHLSGCFKCSSLLACQAPRVQLSNCFPISPSRIHPYSFPLSVSCRLLSRHSVRTSWKFSLEEVGISPVFRF